MLIHNIRDIILYVIGFLRRWAGFYYSVAAILLGVGLNVFYAYKDNCTAIILWVISGVFFVLAVTFNIMDFIDTRKQIEHDDIPHVH